MQEGPVQYGGSSKFESKVSFDGRVNESKSRVAICRCKYDAQ